ncbi:MAG: alpha-E domain-containing protein, partial [Rhodobacteraceae bacterium]|nr:alpha-E domain-containing protein [Paracoccaceae bacterium]
LFWLGRYVERAEGNMRLFRAYHARVAEGLSRNHPLLVAMHDLMAPGAGGRSAVMALSFESPLASALNCASRVRDLMSVDGAMTLQDLGDTSRRYASANIPEEEIAQKVSVLLRKITGFAGLVHENMYRSTGWRFLSLGMSLERAASMAAILAALAREGAPEGARDLALELGDSAMAHRGRYSGVASPTSVADLLALDNDNPRSILYHLSRAKTQISQLPGASDHGRLAPAQRLALKLHTRLAVETPETLTPAKLLGMREGIWRLSDLLLSTYLT